MRKLRKPDAYKGKGVRYADVPIVEARQDRQINALNPCFGFLGTENGKHEQSRSAKRDSLAHSPQS